MFSKKGKILMFFGKEIKQKVSIRMHYIQADIEIPPKIALQPEFFLYFPFSLVLLKDFLKICSIFSLSIFKYGQNSKKSKNV